MHSDAGTEVKDWNDLCCLMVTRVVGSSGRALHTDRAPDLHPLRNFAALVQNGNRNVQSGLFSTWWVNERGIAETYPERPITESLNVVTWLSVTGLAYASPAPATGCSVMLRRYAIILD